ncbi:Enoyl-CoA hydratase, mitochondrial [Hondaea fermentalgiana]|uniref:Enoyl-CoA hydratase, mitochondrial n=1 Tax=Hondaea fermentalgiana TaxID=2315210 RepID=A0A2R5GQV9_9STRA|nr:Enoyl-CoA hydratase, mitochondrial [Hondaea fermentalgiana]|eukprot:GBG30741.1 Enoyl-CoA hydratase, mitochondrial [Hondaea fermentalgiana]
MSVIQLYRDDGSTVDYKLTSFTVEVKEKGVAVVSNATPKSLHALTTAFRTEMFFILEHCKRCDDIKVLIWTAQGDRAFSSGASFKAGVSIDVDPAIMKEYSRRGMSPNLATDMALVRETKAFFDFPKPIIGAINGMAVGGGANIALFYFDCVIASEQAKFTYPFVSIGLTPELGSSLMLPFFAGPHRAKEVILTGDWFSAQDARDWGLLNYVVPHKDLMSRAMEMALKLAAQPANQLMLSKRILNHHLGSFIDEHLNLENTTILASRDAFGGAELFAQLASRVAAKKGNKSKL